MTPIPAKEIYDKGIPFTSLLTINDKSTPAGITDAITEIKNNIAEFEHHMSAYAQCPEASA